MTETISLLLKQEPVKRVTLAPSPARAPSVAVVYARRDGDLEVLDGGKPMRWSDQMFTKYSTRYEVDISDHHVDLKFEGDTALPTEGDVYQFHATCSANFRVTDPAEVVRRNVRDGAPLVHGYLLRMFRAITRQYSIEEAEEAEAAIHAQLRRDTLLHGGITLYAVAVRLSLDEAGRKYLQDVEQARRDEKIKAAQHHTNVNDVARQSQLDLLQQTGQHLLQDRERALLSGQSMDAESLIRLHLQRNPGDTAGAMKMLAEVEDAREAQRVRENERWEGLLEKLANSGIAQPSDLTPLLDAAVRHVEGSGPPIRATATVHSPQQPPEPAAIGWDAPLAGVPAPEVSMVPPAVNANALAAPPNLCPVYVVVDESEAASPWLDRLNEAVGDLYRALAGQPRDAAPLRLAVCGFAEDVAVRAKLAAVEADPRVPRLTGRGPASYTALFEWLRDHVAADAEALRAEHPSVRRPLVVLLSAGTPAGVDDWAPAHRQLLGQLRRPDIVAFGFGGAGEAAASFALFPEYAFTAEGAPETAADRFATFLRGYLLACGQAALAGTESPLPAPVGFRPAGGPA